MSMLDSLFNKGFKGAKCKTLLKLTIPRIKLLRNRREIQLKNMRRDIAKLLETGQEATARIRVEHIIREEKMMAAQEIIELFCELIAVRLPIIETQRECPLDLKEAISSVCFAAPRCADLPELQQVQILFSSKYGKEFVSAATELMPDCGVNRQLIELLSVRAPPADAKLKLLKEIAEEHELDWDPVASETELFKPHEDLLDGTNQFVSGSKAPLPEKKHDESLYSAPVEASHEQSDSDSGLDSLDLPEVPKVSLRPSPDPAPEMVPPPCPAPPRQLSNSSGANENISCGPDLESEAFMPELSVASPYGASTTSVSKREDKQFIPFIAPPSLSSASFPARQSESVPSVARTKSALTQATADIAEHEATPAAYSFPLRQSEPVPSLDRNKSEVNVDLQDVLAAAHAAADTAERAAAAARSAASLAQVRISELIKKRTDRASETKERLFQDDSPEHSSTAEVPLIDHQQSFGCPGTTSYSLDPLRSHGSNQGSEMPNSPSYDTPNVGYESRCPSDQVHDKSTHHQPQRLTSMEDDPYFSYPNLFTRQDSNLGSGSADNSRSTHEL